MSQRVPDDISYEIRGEFEKILRDAEDLELFVEENLFELSSNIKKGSIISLRESLNEFIAMYDEFLSNVLSIAGEIRGYSRRGAEKIRHLEELKEILANLIEDLKDLAGFAKEYVANESEIEKIKEDIIGRINTNIKLIREYIAEQLSSDLKAIAEELQKVERYYEEFEEA